jgi:hypothetical protein
MISATTRLVFGVLGTLMAIGGLATITLGGAAAASGLWLTILGVVVVVAVVVERQRYRSEDADKSFEPVGPGGGEPGAVDPRFRPSDELFVDPTTGLQMRVHIDPRTGERRYVAER